MISGKQIKATSPFEARGRRALATLLCLSIALWSLMPLKAHSETASDTDSGLFDAPAEHGHEHGDEEELYRLMHGHHHHDAADHDHAQALVGPCGRDHPVRNDRQLLVERPLVTGAPFAFRIERPPRA